MESPQISLPDDIALKIVSYLQVSEICSLGCCSRFWRDLCGSDCIWASLSKQRWPLMALSKDSNDSVESETRESRGVESEEPFSSIKGWRSFYIKWHKEMADRAASVVKFVEQCSQSDSLEVGDYLRAIGDLHSMELGFEDVQQFLFTTKQNILLNLIGLHYSLFWLGIPVEDVTEALSKCQITERQVCVRWWKLGRWFYGFRLRDESRFLQVSLSELVTPKEEEVLGVLRRGAVHEVLRVLISANHASTLHG